MYYLQKLQESEAYNSMKLIQMQAIYYLHKPQESVAYK